MRSWRFGIGRHPGYWINLANIVSGHYITEWVDMPGLHYTDEADWLDLDTGW